MKYIDGKAIAEKVKDAIAQEIYALNGPRPNLAIILVGERPDSKLYVSLKEREAKKVGIDTHLYSFSEEASETELLESIKFLNDDPLIDGILIQLPLPDHLDADKIVFAIDPEKDADGFRPEHPSHVISPVLASIEACLEDINFEAEGKRACVLYNSEIFGESVRELLAARGMKVDMRDHSDDADLLVTALGRPHEIKKEMIKEGAVIIDIGISKEEKKVYGDVDAEDVSKRASFLTPVPGGIGPMTIAFLFRNVLALYKNKKKTAS